PQTHTNAAPDHSRNGQEPNPGRPGKTRQPENPTTYASAIPQSSHPDTQRRTPTTPPIHLIHHIHRRQTSILKIDTLPTLRREITPRQRMHRLPLRIRQHRLRLPRQIQRQLTRIMPTTTIVKERLTDDAAHRI